MGRWHFGLGAWYPELGEMLDFGGWLIQVGREAFAGSPAGQELAGELTLQSEEGGVNVPAGK